MFRLDVLQNQWLFLAMIGGLALLFFVVLFYPPLWRQRDQVSEEHIRQGDEKQSLVAWLRSFMPGYLLILYIALAVWGVAYVIRVASKPPSW